METVRMTTSVYNHFSDWLANLQGKENRQVPNEIIDAVVHEIERTKMTGELSENDIRRCLKKIGHHRYYDHVTQILFRITTVPPLQMTLEME